MLLRNPRVRQICWFFRASGNQSPAMRRRARHADFDRGSFRLRQLTLLARGLVGIFGRRGDDHGRLIFAAGSTLDGCGFSLEYLPGAVSGAFPE